MHRLLALFAFFLCLSSCNHPPGAGVEPDRKLVRYLPVDATMLAGVDVKGLTASPLYQRHQGEVDPRQLDELTKGLGIDLRRDVSQALVAFNQGQFVLLADGHFDALQRTSSMALPKPDVLALGPKPFLDRVANNDTRLSAAMRERLERVPKADQIWVVSTQGLPLERLPIPADIRSALANISDNIRGFSIGGGADAGAHFQAELICDSEAGGKRVHDALRGVIGMGRLMTRDDQMGMLKLYDAIQVEQDHAIVRVHADLSSEDADSAIALLRSLKRR